MPKVPGQQKPTTFNIILENVILLVYFLTYPTEAKFRPRVISDGIRFHHFRFSFAPLSPDVLFTKSMIKLKKLSSKKFSKMIIRKVRQ